MTEIVVANRDGLAIAPDGSKHRLARGRTLGDARHPLVQAHPELFSRYEIALSVDDPDGDAAAERGDIATWPAKVAEVEALADEYRTQLAAIVEVLHERGKLPEDSDTAEPGWLARAVADALDALPAETDSDDPADPALELPTLPARRRTPRRAAAPRPDET